MKFNGIVDDFKTKANEFTAKKFDGIAWIEFEKTRNTPSVLKIDAKCAKGGVIILIQHMVSGEEPIIITNFIGSYCETRSLDDYKEGIYKIMAVGKNSENVSVKYEFI